MFFVGCDIVDELPVAATQVEHRRVSGNIFGEKIRTKNFPNSISVFSRRDKTAVVDFFSSPGVFILINDFKLFTIGKD
jgi:hypothetical protein